MNAKLLTAVAVLALTVCAFGGIMMVSDESDAAGDVYFTSEDNSLYTNQGTAANPITDLTKGYSSSSSSALGAVKVGAHLDGIYVVKGAPVSLAVNPTQPIIVGAISVSSGFGVSISTGSLDTWSSSNSQWADAGSVTGTFTKTGNCTITFLQGTPTSPVQNTFTIHVVESEEDIDFTSPSAVSGISGGSISYTAQTNIDATFSESGGTGASWLSVNSSTGKVTGTFPTVTSMTSYTYIIKATSETNSSNTATQTITIDVYPVAKISATTTNISGTEGEAISSVTLSGNLDMTFAKSSGSWPAGVTMNSSGVIQGVPLSEGSYTVVVKGTTTEGPVQNPTITIRFNIEAAENELELFLSGNKESYKVGESVSILATSNVSGTTYKVSGTAASFLSVSGSSIVGSVPSSYSDVTDVTLSVTAETPGGQTAVKTITFSVEPVLAFTTVPTADCIITPVYEYDEDGNPVLSSKAKFMTEVSADTADFSFTDTLTILATFTGQNADTVTWYWGDGSSDVGNKVQHTYEEPGTYEIRLVASNDVGESDVTISVTVGDAGNDLLFYLVIVVLVIIVVYLAYRILSGNKRRGH